MLKDGSVLELGAGIGEDSTPWPWKPLESALHAIWELCMFVIQFCPSSPLNQGPY